jgi:hypothetical protein
MASPDQPSLPGDLSGWKEVAAHLCRSVRTVQRWEKELGLPIRRVRTAAGEVIYARRDDLGEWLDSRVGRAAVADASNGKRDSGEVPIVPANGPGANGQTEPSGRSGEVEARLAERTGPAVAAPAISAGPGRRQWLGPVALSLGVVGAIALVALWWLSGLGRRREPAAWVVEKGTLVVQDARGRTLWTHDFDPLLRTESLGGRHRSLLNDRLTDAITIVDLDGDGSSEVVVAAWGESRHSALYCFESDGRVRFKHAVSRTVRFGNRTFGPPFALRPPLMTREAGRTFLWAPFVDSEFPATLQKLTALGEVAGEYWQAGHIRTAHELEQDGRRLLLVGGVRNEDATGSLAVLDVENPTASAPAAKDEYRCTSCPKRPPEVFMTFPRPEIGRLFGERAEVTAIDSRPGNKVRIAVTYSQLKSPEHPACFPATGFYHLDDRLRVVSADYGDNYIQCHAHLKLSGKLEHDFGPRDVAELFPVWRWRNGVAERVDGPEVDAATEASAAGSR